MRPQTAALLVTVGRVLPFGFVYDAPWIAEYAFGTCNVEAKNVVSPCDCTVSVRSTMSETDEVIILAHEIGHAIENVGRPYILHQLTRLCDTVGDEARAWEHAVTILREIGFQDWLRFNELLLPRLESYMENHGW